MVEYLEDYAPEETKLKGYKLLQEKLDEIEDESFKTTLTGKINKIKEGQRDLYF